MENSKEFPSKRLFRAISCSLRQAMSSLETVFFWIQDLFVDEAALTGETYPVEKSVGILPPETPSSQRTNSALYGKPMGSAGARSISHPNRKGDRIWKGFRTAETEDPRRQNRARCQAILGISSWRSHCAGDPPSVGHQRLFCATGIRLFSICFGACSRTDSTALTSDHQH